MGTWRLVEKPPNAIPIANKWTFLKKRNKAGEVIKFKARLVAKKCAQRPGHDYVKTCCLNGCYLSHFGISSNKRLENLTIGHQRCIPKWGIEGKSLYATT